MKTLFLTWTPGFAGGEKHLVGLIQRLDLSKVQPAIFCFGMDPYSRILNDQLRLGIDIKTGLSGNSFFRTWLEFRKKKPDAVVFATGWVGTFPWYVFLAARLSGAKRLYAIYHNFSEIPERVPNNGHWVLYLARRAFGWRVRLMLGLKIVVALTHRSICVSEKLRESLVGDFGYPREKTVTVHNGVDLRFYGAPDARAAGVRRELGIGPDEVVLVSACRLVPAKGVDVLLRAVNSLRDEVPKLKCVIVGEGPCGEELRKASAEMGLSSKVFFVGFKGDVRPYLQAGDIFVNPSSASYVECLPLAVLEAMASSLPCIGSSAGGVPEIISHQEDGLLVTPGSVGELRAAIKRLACDGTERKRMGERAREKVRLEFDLERSVEELKAILLQSG